MKKRDIILFGSIILLLVILSTLGFFSFRDRNILKELSVEDVIEKVSNKDTFVLCISRTDCAHCKSFKPKLKNVSKKYGVKIYYIDIDKYSDEEQNEFVKYVSFDKSTPVTAFIKNGEETTASNRIFGNVSTDKIIEKFKKNGFIEE